MQIIEFEAKSYEGVIRIPRTYKDWYDKPVKVILMSENVSETIRKDIDKADLLCFFQSARCRPL